MPPPQIKRQVLTFDDLPLQDAIAKLFDSPGFVKSELTLISDEGREWILQSVISLLPQTHIGAYRFEHILLSINQFRKMGKESLAKRRIIIGHARKLQQIECFYQGKLTTQCSHEVDLDRIKPGKRDGQYTIENTVLSCSRHNRSRGCKEVEQFWKQ